MDNQRQSPMKFLIVCRRNQIRSPFLSQYLKMLFDGNSYDSCGVDTLPNTSYHPVLEKISSQFGFSFKNSACKSIFEIDLGQYDVIFSVDQMTHEKVTNFVSTNFNNMNIPLILGTSEIDDEMLKPTDPPSAEGNIVLHELIKLISAFLILNGHRSFFNVYIPRNPTDAKSANSVAMAELQTQFGELIDINEFKFTPIRVNSGFDFFTELQLSNSIPHLASLLLKAFYDPRIPLERVLLNWKFTEFLLGDRKLGELSVVAPPLLISGNFTTASLALTIGPSKITVVN